MLRFGKVVREADSGPALPPAVADRGGAASRASPQIRKEEIGFRTVDAGPAGPLPARSTDEALMLTGDENIVKLEFIVQYKVTRRRRPA